MKERRLALVLAALLAATLVFAACGGDSDPTATPETLFPTHEAEPTPTTAASAADAAVPTEEPTADPNAEAEGLVAEIEMANLTALVEHPWQWMSFTSPVEELEVEDPELYLLTFDPDGTVGIKADCNNASGSYTAGSSLTIQVGPMTMAACPPESRSDQFVQLLGGAAIYFLEDGHLYIDLMADGGTMAFAPTDEAAAADDGEGAMAGALPEETAAQLDAFLQSQVYSEGGNPEASAPGLVLLVDTPDGRYLNAAGVANIEDGTPMQVDDRLEIGSNSKSFTIVVLMQLQEEGVLSIDDPLSQWLPEWAEKFPNGDQMNLRQLAQHTAGIWDYGDPLIGEAANDPAKLEQGYAPEELAQYAVDNGTPDFAPGEEGQWNYSNTGYILLGMIIEKATGQSLGELYRERIFEPLGLETADLIEGVPEAGEITDGYWWKDDGTRLNTTNWNVSQGWAAGGIAMTAEELLTYAKALAAGELFKDPATLAEMLAFDPNGMTGLMPYGLGLMDFSLVGAPGSWGHEGQTAGFQSLWFTNPESGVTVVGLTNSAAYKAFSFLNVAGLLTSQASAEADTAGPVLLATHPWQWVAFVSPVEEVEVEMPESYLVKFNEDNTVNIVADCNNASGSYTADGSSLTIEVGPMTMAACPPESLSDRFVQLLRGAAMYYFEDGNLHIDLMADGGTIVFAPADAEAMADDGEGAIAGALPEEIVAQLDAFLQSQVYSEGGIPEGAAPGLVLLVDTPDGRYLNAAGVSSLEEGTPIQVDDHLEIGSNSKSFLVVVLMQLQEEGVLSLDDKLSAWLPELAAELPNGDEVTLYQLANHISGIPDYTGLIGAFLQDPEKLTQGYTPEELVQSAIENDETQFLPGEEGRWKYNNTSYVLLGLVAEAATGKSLGEPYRERIFDPLGLETAILIEGVPQEGEIDSQGYYQRISDGGLANSTHRWEDDGL